MRYSFFLGVVLAAIPFSLSRAPNDPDTFANPASNVRPRFRYWLPDASVDGDIVSQDIADVATIGAGGIELVPFFDYGGALNPHPPINWSAYNFGTPPFVDIFKRALNAHADHGLVMDFALGPNQGQGVPAEVDNKGLQWDMMPFTAEVPRTGEFKGKLPGWGSGELVALVTALVKSNQTIPYEVPGLWGQPLTSNYEEFKLSHRTLSEQTNKVDERGNTQLSFPRPPQGSHYRVFAFYERLAGEKNLKFPSDRQATIFDNGSYAVDHFDANGAAVVSQFWKDHILTDEVPGLLASVGNYAWEDSLEIIFNVTWSRSLPTRFQKLHGYSIKPYLPLLTFRQNTIVIQADLPGSFRCILDTDDQGLSYVNDFRAALVAGYKEYLTALADWTREIGVQLSAQPAYGSVMDMLAVIPAVDAPECESLSFFDNLDMYRAFSGPARLSGKKVISNEMGAVQGSAYNYHLPSLLFSVNRAFLGGVNQMVIHGQAYSGPYPNTTWPGHTAFGYLFSELFSPKLPSWDHGLRQVMDYISRGQYVLQNGIPKADVVMYHKESATTIKTIYQGEDLRKEGWSWNYLSADNLMLQQAKVQNGILAPDGPAWKAFIVESSQNLTMDAVRALTSFARDDLPVVFSGGVPGYYPTGNDSDNTNFKSELSRLLRSRNVHTVSGGRVAHKLSALGLRPRVEVKTNGTCYTIWAEAEGMGYAVVYSDLTKSTGSITVASTETPYYMNPWNGEITPVLVYKRTKTTTTIPVNLGGNQTLFLAFSDTLRREIPVPSYSVHDIPSHVLGAHVTHNQKIALHVAHSESQSHAILSTGRNISLDNSSVPRAFQLSNWTLAAEHWEAPEDLYDSTNTVKYNTTHHLSTPISWSEIPQLANTSGVGYYTTILPWPPLQGNTDRSGPAQTLGAYLSFSRVVDTLTVSVNGHQVPPLDITNAVVDISPYLRSGQNRVEVTVPTTLWNYLRTILSELVTAGVPARSLGGVPPRSEAGLVGDVRIIPYVAVVA
ncbi:hypothetical protein BDW59DRAFT_180464 [Aspergillus cavernicola]|uniref:Secreted protein n=1 Tax=Aspergillus cavernicola TaxID=176166 RepID=A0ABR4I978_9EURO